MATAYFHLSVNASATNSMNRFPSQIKAAKVSRSLGFILTKTTQTIPLLTVGTLVPFAHPGRETRSKLLCELSVFHACCQVDAQLGAPSLSFVF